VYLRTSATATDSALVDSLANRRNVTNIFEPLMITSYLPLNVIGTLSRDANVSSVEIDDQSMLAAQSPSASRSH
jgi:hypothetical protein